MGVASSVVLTVFGFFNVVSYMLNGGDGPIASLGRFNILPLALAALPILVGAGLLAAGRGRNFGLGMVIGAGVLLVIDTVACFALLLSS